MGDTIKKITNSRLKKKLTYLLFSIIKEHTKSHTQKGSVLYAKEKQHERKRKHEVWDVEIKETS